MNAPAKTTKLAPFTLLDEPRLAFSPSEDHTHVHPLRGLLDFGPFSQVSFGDYTPSLRIATVGPNSTFKQRGELMRLLIAPQTPTDRAEYVPAYPGFEAVFRAGLKSALAEANAQLRAAEVNLGFTEIRAPISGRIGRAQVTEGALVSAQGEVLTTIQQLDPVYADMQQPVSELLRLRAELASGRLTEVEPGAARVVLLLDDGSQYEHAGKLLFAEAAVERSSGQVTLRAEFPNPDGVLLPGMYVRVSVEQATSAAAIAIPSQAVQRSASGAAQVYVVTAEGTAALKPVVLGRATGNRVIVEEGLSEGETLIVDGFQKMGPGAPVAPVCWADPSLSEPPADVCIQRLGGDAAAGDTN